MSRIPIYAAAIAALTGFSGAAVAGPADPEIWAPRMAETYVTMMGMDAETADLDAVGADMRRLIAAFGQEPLLAEKGPPAFVQAVELAQHGSVSATRGAMYDLARDILLTAAKMSGQPADSFIPLDIWSDVDPFHAELTLGLGLAASDIAAMDKLKALEAQSGLQVIPAAPSEELVMKAWRQQEDEPVNNVLPTRLQAWADGVEAAWPELNDGEREAALGALFRSEVPSQSLLRKVLGTEDIVHWLAGVDLPMSETERQQSRELVHFMEMGAFAGPLKQPLIEIAQMRAAQGSAAGLGAAATQLMRLNNWSAMTGEMHSWESYRYMTQGY
ncbi:hypothetical protein [Paracoccus alkanivorans]|uniref:Uncharacterized protein n=1 Tax=Paracoccus alkanivorans TaxID=2116655 RepID=A0A3M0MB11_9RHOB|nr:hypothetical protein [Paracoccus alkanivorans]RMC34932.1 hypothetical protein C9E81_12650 [Paracoccus alkanivorans]